MDRLEELRREVARERRARPAPAPPPPPAPARPRVFRWRRLLVVPLGLVLLGLPVVTLLRGSTALYLHAGWPTWAALAGAAAVAAALVAGYAALLSRKLTGRARLRFVATWIAAPLVVAHCVHGLLFLARVNAKTDDVRTYYRALHPALRLAVSTFVIVDDGQVVTDIHRTAADYDRMRLPVYESSLHFRQADGWVHAMDLRTIGRGRVRNWVTAASFRLLGFRTLRHVGTADHLHVSLPLPP
ncbi:MAG: hypothetical protein OER21_08720 [Gemmatimonadota bacterium]|nr:hypothetical protein [Gemmatimonadota bacterium]